MVSRVVVSVASVTMAAVESMTVIVLVAGYVKCYGRAELVEVSSFAVVI